MDKKALIKEIAEDTGYKQSSVDAILDGLGRVVAERLSRGEEVTLTGIGKLKAARRAARTARNPTTGEAVAVPAKTVAKLTPAKALQDRLNG